jgi:hypothetical protein
MAVGVVGLILSMLFWSSWRDRRTAVVERPVVRGDRDYY